MAISCLATLLVIATSLLCAYLHTIPTGGALAGGLAYGRAVLMVADRRVRGRVSIPVLEYVIDGLTAVTISGDMSSEGNSISSIMSSGSNAHLLLCLKGNTLLARPMDTLGSFQTGGVRCRMRYSGRKPETRQQHILELVCLVILV
jgi:hypothetical protein